MRRAHLHIYPSDFTHETRILKETGSIARSGICDKIFIGALWRPGLEVHESLDDIREVWRVPLKTRKLPDGSLWKIPKFIEWQWKVFRRYCGENVGFVNCHSLSVLPMGVVFKLWCGARLIYDAHELETETDMSNIRRWLSKCVERLLIRHASAIIVVSESIGKWYGDHYGLANVHVVRNVPYRGDRTHEGSKVLKEKFCIVDDDILFICQGALEKGRGIETLLSVFSKIDRKRHIVFMGFGSLEKDIKRYAEEYKNIHFHPSVRPEEVMYYTASADIGIHLIENTCLNHYYCLPNKVFEYFLAGLPFIVSDFPEMAKLVHENECGWGIAVNENSVREVIEKISRVEIQERKDGVLRNRGKFGWDKEEEVLLRIYRGMA